jgi:hypothetical protein
MNRCDCLAIFGCLSDLHLCRHRHGMKHQGDAGPQRHDTGAVWEGVTSNAVANVLGWRDVPHSFKNESSKPAKMLISVAPAGLEGCFSRSASLSPTTALPPTKAEIEKLLAVAPKYGIETKPD